MRKPIEVIEVRCDCDGKIIPENHKVISINNLDFCSTKCVEEYIVENSTIVCPVCNGDENIKCEYCGNFRKINRPISDILEYGNDKMICQKCDGKGDLDNHTRDDLLFNVKISPNQINYRIPNKVCYVCNGQGVLKIIPNKRV